jgi:hypothetical protein
VGIKFHQFLIRYDGSKFEFRPELGGFRKLGVRILHRIILVGTTHWFYFWNFVVGDYGNGN